MKNVKLTILSEGETWGNANEPQLDVIKKYGVKAAVTDLCIATGTYLPDDSDYTVSDDLSLAGRSGYIITKSANDLDRAVCTNRSGEKMNSSAIEYVHCIRPVLVLDSDLFSSIVEKSKEGVNGVREVEFGEYPQYAASVEMQNILEEQYVKGLNKTGRNYTFNSTKYIFKPLTYDEYEYQSKKYVRVKDQNNNFGENPKFSNGFKYVHGESVWLEVSPVVWLVDEKTKKLIAKRGLVSGISLLDKNKEFDFDFANDRNRDYKGDFDNTLMSEFLDKYMLKDLFQSVKLKNNFDLISEEKDKYEQERVQLEKIRNLNGLNVEEVNEEIPFRR